MLTAIEVRRHRCIVTIAIVCIGVLATKCQLRTEASSNTITGSSGDDMEACQCITHSGTGGNEWGALLIAPNITAATGATSGDCLVVYIRAAPDEIVEMRLYEIILRPQCIDSVQVHAHLRSATITQTALNDELICAESAGSHIANRHPHAVDQLWEEHMLNVGAMGDADHRAVDWSADATVRLDWQGQREAATRLRINNRRAILSSGPLLAVRLRLGPVPDSQHQHQQQQHQAPVSVKADFRFHQRALFKIDGNLLPTTLCDYQFLPYPINYGRQSPPMVADGGGAQQVRQFRQQDSGGSHQQPPAQPALPVWRYFFSPRYPAKYAAHVKCAYKFIGRPNSYVEVLFEEIDLPPAMRNAAKSCAGASDRLTIYDSRLPDTTTIVDVLCQAAPRQRKRIHSAGAQLLIEFESSSNRSSNGFSAKYRFVETFAAVPQTAQIDNAPPPPSAVDIVQRPDGGGAAATRTTTGHGDTGRGQLLDGTSSSSGASSTSSSASSGHSVDQLTAFGFSYISRGESGQRNNMHNINNSSVVNAVVQLRSSMASMAQTVIVNGGGGGDQHRHQQPEQHQYQQHALQHLVLAASGVALRTGSPTEASSQSSQSAASQAHDDSRAGGVGEGGDYMNTNMGEPPVDTSENNSTSSSPDTGDSNQSGRAGDSGCPPVPLWS